MVGPAKKRVRFGRRVKFERPLVELDGHVVVAADLVLVGFLQQIPRRLKRLHVHHLCRPVTSTSR